MIDDTTAHILLRRRGMNSEVATDFARRLFEHVSDK